MRTQTIVSPSGHTLELVNLLDETFNKFYSESDARAVLSEGDTLRPGEFAFARFVAENNTISLEAGRTLGVPARIAIQSKGEWHTRFFVSHTIAEIRDAWMQGTGNRWTKPFSPGYTMMLPAFYRVSIDTIHVRDWQYDWFLSGPEHALYPDSEMLPPDTSAIGTAYMNTLYEVVADQLTLLSNDQPIGVSLSGGADSTAVLTALCHVLDTAKRDNPLWVYTLAIDGGGTDAAQASAVVATLQKDPRFENRIHHLFVPVRSADIDKDALIEKASRVTEEYHMHDVGCAMAGLLLYQEMSRLRDAGVVPPLSCDFNGDGGNEIFRDYPLVDPAYAVIPLEHVLNDPLLLLLGYHLRRLAYNAVFSSGLSRGYARTFNPARLYNVIPFSPLVDRRMTDVCQHTPLRQMIHDPADLYAIRPKVVSGGIKATLGIDMPAFQKSRFQEGCAADPKFLRITAEDVNRLRREVLHA